MPFLRAPDPHPNPPKIVMTQDAVTPIFWAFFVAETEAENLEVAFFVANLS